MSEDEVKRISHLQNWVDSIIMQELLPLLEAQKVIRRLVELIAQRSEGESEFFARDLIDSLRYTFANAIVVATCRQTDRNNQTLSLVQLMDAVRRNRGLLTKSWFVNRYTNRNEMLRGKGESDWKENFGGSDALDCCSVQEDIDHILYETKRVREYRDKYIAHCDEKRMTLEINIADLEFAIKAIEKYIHKYNLLLRQAYTDTSLGYLEWGWETIFAKTHKSLNG